jgi:enoyl-CoA hydratase/carnithine racemase
MKTAIKLAKNLSSGPAALKYTKEAINRAYDFESSKASKLASKLYAQTYITKDNYEGITAYLEKREPVFKGR